MDKAPTQALSVLRSGKALASHRCDPGSMLAVGMKHGHVVKQASFFRVLRFPTKQRPREC